MEALCNARREARGTALLVVRQAREQQLQGSELRRHLRRAYPFAVRRGFHYRVWLEELHRASGSDVNLNRIQFLGEKRPKQRLVFPDTKIPMKRTDVWL